MFGYHTRRKTWNFTSRAAFSLYNLCMFLYIDKGRYIKLFAKVAELVIRFFGNSTILDCLIMVKFTNARKFIPKEMTSSLVKTNVKMAGVIRTYPAVTYNRKHPSSSIRLSIWDFFSTVLREKISRQLELCITLTLRNNPDAKSCGQNLAWRGHHKKLSNFSTSRWSPCGKVQPPSQVLRKRPWEVSWRRWHSKSGIGCLDHISASHKKTLDTSFLVSVKTRDDHSHKW